MIRFYNFLIYRAKLMFRVTLSNQGSLIPHAYHRKWNINYTLLLENEFYVHLWYKKTTVSNIDYSNRYSCLQFHTLDRINTKVLYGDFTVKSKTKLKKLVSLLRCRINFVRKTSRYSSTDIHFNALQCAFLKYSVKGSMNIYIYVHFASL